MALMKTKDGVPWTLKGLLNKEQWDALYRHRAMQVRALDGQVIYGSNYSGHLNYRHCDCLEYAGRKIYCRYSAPGGLHTLFRRGHHFLSERRLADWVTFLTHLDGVPVTWAPLQQRCFSVKRTWLVKSNLRLE